MNIPSKFKIPAGFWEKSVMEGNQSSQGTDPWKQAQPYIARIGTTAITIAAGNISGSVAVTIAPPLPDALANYKLLVGGNSAATFTAANGRLSSQSTLIVIALRIVGTINVNSTGVTVAGNDLANVDVTINNPHGSDAGVGPHNHTTTGHPVTDPTHNHTLNTTGAISASVDWLIVHI